MPKTLIVPPRRPSKDVPTGEVRDRRERMHEIIRSVVNEIAEKDAEKSAPPAPPPPHSRTKTIRSRSFYEKFLSTDDSDDERGDPPAAPPLPPIPAPHLSIVSDSSIPERTQSPAPPPLPPFPMESNFETRSRRRSSWGGGESAVARRKKSFGAAPDHRRSDTIWVLEEDPGGNSFVYSQKHRRASWSTQGKRVVERTKDGLVECMSPSHSRGETLWTVHVDGKTGHPFYWSEKHRRASWTAQGKKIVRGSDPSDHANETDNGTPSTRRRNDTLWTEHTDEASGRPYFWASKHRRASWTAVGKRVQGSMDEGEPDSAQHQRNPTLWIAYQNDQGLTYYHSEKHRRSSWTAGGKLTTDEEIGVNEHGAGYSCSMGNAAQADTRYGLDYESPSTPEDVNGDERTFSQRMRASSSDQSDSADQGSIGRRSRASSGDTIVMDPADATMLMKQQHQEVDAVFSAQNDEDGNAGFEIEGKGDISDVYHREENVQATAFPSSHAPVARRRLFGHKRERSGVWETEQPSEQGERARTSFLRAATNLVRKGAGRGGKAKCAACGTILKSSGTVHPVSGEFLCHSCTTQHNPYVASLADAPPGVNPL